MKLDQALKVKRAGWLEAVEKEYQRMMDSGVFEFVRREEKPVDALILSSTWACKHKSDGTLRARLNCRG